MSSVACGGRFVGGDSLWSAAADEVTARPPTRSRLFSLEDRRVFGEPHHAEDLLVVGRQAGDEQPLVGFSASIKMPMMIAIPALLT